MEASNCQCTGRLAAPHGAGRVPCVAMFVGSIYNIGRVATGLPCQAELVASGAVHQKLVGLYEIHPQDGEGHVRFQEGPLEGAVPEALPLS